MSALTVSRPARVGLSLASVLSLIAGSFWIVAPAVAAGPAAAPTRTAVGAITPIALTHGSATHGGQPAVAQPFRTLDADALRAAKLHAAAVASRGQRGPVQAAHTPLAGVFGNANRPGLNQLTVAPPDSTGAIGPNHYVEMVNQQIGVYDRNLTLLSSSDNGAFMGAGSVTVTDPQIQWDGQGGHWLYAALGVSTGANMLLFGWSKTADPSDLTNGWCLFGTPRGSSLDDYPKLGHDDHFISIGTNVYDDTGGVYTFETANVFAIRKPQLGDASCSVDTVRYVADAAHPLLNADGSTAFTPVPANTADASPNGYIVAAHSPVDGVGSSAPKIMVWHWTSAGGVPTLVADGDVAVSTFGVPAPVPQAGTSDVLDTLDARLTQAVAVTDPAAGAKGIWTQHTIAGPGGRSIVRWYEIVAGSPPSLRQQGDIGSPTDSVWNGAISPSIGGDSAAVFYNRGGGSVLPVIAAQSRTSATALNAMDPGELVIAQSTATDLDFTCQYSKPSDPCRWGDYAGASPDPANPGVIWGSSQITGPCTIFCGFFAQWQTQNFAVVASAGSPPVPPGPPTLNAPTAGNGVVDLSWSAPSSTGGAPITNYAVYRATASGGETFLATTGGALTYHDAAVTNGTTYFYQVAAINSAGTGALSNERSATPSAPAVPPSAPTLNVPTAGNGSVGLSWSAPASNGGAAITNYAVYRSTASGGETFLANTGGALTYTDLAVSNGTTYFYQVAAINSAGTGARSNERSATPSAPATPDFSLAVTPTTRTVSRGSSTTYTVTVTAANGFSGFVNLSATISPAATGVTMSFNPTGVTIGPPGSAQTTFTVGTSKKTQRRTFTITITGTSGGLVHSTTVTITTR